jgi:hypothetical protein
MFFRGQVFYFTTCLLHNCQRLDFFRTVLSIPQDRMGFTSGNWVGHAITLRCLCFSLSITRLRYNVKECFGLLSSWKMKPHPISRRSFGKLCCSRILLYPFFNSILSISNRSPTWLFPKYLQTITKPPPCSTKAFVQASETRSPAELLAYVRLLDPKISNLDPLVQRTFSHWQIVQCWCFFYHCKHLRLFCLHINGFLIAILSKRLASLRRRFTVNTWTGFGRLPLIFEAVRWGTHLLMITILLSSSLIIPGFGDFLRKKNQKFFF